MDQWEAVTMRKTSKIFFPYRFDRINTHHYIIEKKVEIKKIDPCEKYELRMVFGGQTLELGSIGPYTDPAQDIDLTKVALKDKDFFNNKFTYQLDDDNAKTKVSWNDFFCGKTKVVLQV